MGGKLNINILLERINLKLKKRNKAKNVYLAKLGLNNHMVLQENNQLGDFVDLKYLNNRDENYQGPPDMILS